ncbi:hypothetical protein P167DRAFT_545608 [Morchella conica CCBAS932]|uniref:Uncharacterized protein n=1 Tax=Morchella conica CCBAS932 TaxID=1392247 RepID=A0A3N4KSJ8_9PEZI|nr:hypothetical protein P167DRAFT_545608 [Morchella conica CCBAS932]
MDSSGQDDSLHSMPGCPTMRARATDTEKPRAQQDATTVTITDDEVMSGTTTASDKISESRKGFFLPLEGKDIQFLHLRHPDSGPLERVLFGATPRLIWRYASSIHIPWGNPIYSRASPLPLNNRERSVSPHIESLRGPSPPHICSTGSNDNPPEVNRMAHGDQWTYHYWFYDAEQEHSEDGEGDKEDEVTEDDLCGLETPPFWFIDEDDYGRPLNSAMEPFTFTPWSPPLGYSCPVRICVGTGLFETPTAYRPNWLGLRKGRLGYMFDAISSGFK